jgi:6,7-dimethyl-8-ribityllumazine synthase
MTDSANTQLTNYDNLQISRSQVVLVYTEWNPGIVGELVAGAKRVLSNYPQVSVLAIQVPGAVEIPYAIAQMHRHTPADAYIALGCVIRGETPHFEVVCNAVTQGISQLNIQLDSPVIFGVLTVENETQANDRLGGKHGHKGEEAAIAALKMLSLSQSIRTAK